MSVDLEPPTQLSFHRPFTQLVKEVLTVKNNHNEPVAFKVKTTAPKQYCVRPNSGKIEPGQSVEVQVILQPMKEDPPPDFKCKDKFLVQSVAITPNLETLSLQELWSHTETHSKEKINESKIRCLYLPPINQNPTLNELPNPTRAAPSSAIQPALPSQAFVAPAASGGAPNSAPTSPDDVVPYSNAYAQTSQSEQSASSQIEHRPPPVNTTNGHHPIQPQTPSLIGAFPKEVKDPSIKSVSSFHSDASANPSYKGEDEATRTRRQLFEALEEIKRLDHIVENYKQDLSTAQIRQRKSEEAAEKAGRNIGTGDSAYYVKTEEKIPEGYYPFEVVIAAAIGAFLFGVMFF